MDNSEHFNAFEKHYSKNIKINNDSNNEDDEHNYKFMKENDDFLDKKNKNENKEKKINNEDPFDLIKTIKSLDANKNIEESKLSKLSKLIKNENQIEPEIKNNQNIEENKDEEDKNKENKIDKINNENEKNEKEKIEEFQKELANDIENDNYENNVSDFLEKDNVHLGPIINEQKEKEQDNNKEKENEKDNKNIDIKEEKSKKEDINDKKQKENNDKKEEKKDSNNKHYILNKKDSSKSSNSELMSETELIRMSLSKENNDKKKKKKEKDKEKEDNINNEEIINRNEKEEKINKKEEKDEKEEKEEKENKEKEDIIKEKEKEDINKEEYEKEEKNINKEEDNNEVEVKGEEKEKSINNKKEEEKVLSHKGSESLIDSILLNEIEEISNPENEIIIKNQTKRTIPEKKYEEEIIIGKEIKKEKTSLKINYKTLKDLEKEPFKRIKINSPRSLRVINENGYTIEELYYMPLDRFLFNHKETINMKKSEQRVRYNFYEQFRIDKIKKLCELRDKLIQEENNINKNNENIFEKENINDINNSKYKTVYLSSNNYDKIKNNDDDNELIKKIILENEERIRDNKLERIKAINDAELANLVEYELDKNLFKIELNKQSENYTREIKRLKYEEFKPKNKKKISIKLKNSGNNKPVVNKFTTFNENLKSFHVAKRIKEYDIFQQKLEQKLEKIEMANKKKNENYQMKKKMEYERAKLNLKKSNDKYNKKQNELIKKMKIKDLITDGIKKMINEKNLIKNEINAQRYLSKQDYINKLKKMDEYEREQKYINFVERESKRNRIQNMRNRIHSSRVYRMNDIQKKRKKDIWKIQKILKNGEGEDEENLDILLEEFPNNPKIAEIVRRYQIKKNNIENSYKSKPRLYSPNTINIVNLENNHISQSNDKKRIFIFANNKEEEDDIKKRNNEIKKEVRRTNFINNYKTSESIKQYEEEEENEIKDDSGEVVYEHEIAEKVRKFKVKIYENFLNVLKVEKRNEVLRNKQLEIVTDDTLRKNLEIQFSQERTLVDLRLRKESERLSKQAKDYENYLRNNFQQRQDRFMNQIKEEKTK